MAIIVTPGPLPTDNTRIKVSQVLAQYVNGTRITNFGVDNFSGAPINFVISATDPPATSSRHRGTLWFARGEGKLYKWQLVPHITHISNVTEGRWLSISDRRDMMVHYRQRVAAGDMLHAQNAPSDYPAILDPLGLHTLSVTSTEAQPGARPKTIQVDPSLVCLTAGTGGTDIAGSFQVAVEWGFCNAKVDGDGPFGQYTTLQTDASPAFINAHLMASNISNAGEEACIVADIVGSTATDGLRTQGIFLRPQISNLLHGTIQP